MTNRLAYMIIDTQKDKNDEFIPCIIKEGEAGYYPTDYHWGTDKKIAQKCCDEINKKMGMTKRDVFELICMSMREDKQFDPAM